MNTDDPHLKCHLKSQIILHMCPHHHVVVLKLRCRRSCHNANKICAIMKLSGRIQELQNEINCMNDSKDFQDAESIRSGNFYVTSRPVSLPPHRIPEGMLRHSFMVPSRREGPPSIWDTWYVGKRFCKSRCVIISTASSRIASMENMCPWWDSDLKGRWSRCTR